MLDLPPGRLAVRIVAELLDHSVFKMLHLPMERISHEFAVVVQRVLDAVKEDVKRVVASTIDDAIDR